MKKVSTIPYAAFLPPVILSVLSLVLLVGRMAYMGSDRFVFMTWNLFLAWLPLVLALWLISGLSKNRWLSWQNLALSFLWLVFLPNSFYLVTDFMHLRSSAVGTLLFDSVMFMSFALAGVLLGCMSLRLVHKELAKRLASKTTVKLLLSFFILSGIAIYLGRFLGWNSWDLLTSPQFILSDLFSRLTNTETLPIMLGVSTLLAVFIAVCYSAFYIGIKSIKLPK